MKVSSREPSASTRVKGSIADALRALRPHQWLKNVLIAVPALAAHRFSTETIGNVLVAFVAFSLCASSVYVINDLIDREHDRTHPRKRNRPFASGALTPGFGVGLAVALLVGALGISLFLPQAFLLVLCGYFLLTLAYSVYLKRFLMLDALVLACLYGARVVAGGIAAAATPSEWLVAFCVFFFLCLALVKRITELKSLTQETNAHLTGRPYRAEDLQGLQALAGAAGMVSVLVLALYVSSPQVQTLYSHPVRIWGVGLVLMVWIGRAILIASRGQMHDDPVIFAATDRASLVLVLAAAVILLFSL